MFDATKLLGALMQQRATPSAGSRLDAAAQRGAGGGGLGDLLSQLGAGGGGGGLGGLLGGLLGGGSGGGQGGTLGGLAEMAKRAVNAPGQELQRNNPAAVGGLGALAGALFGGGRGAVGGGLMAVLGSLAYAALQGQGQAPASAAALPGYDDPAEVQRKALLMLRAMIQAAKSDGQIDAREMERITARLDEAGEDHEARNFVLQQLRGPVDVEGLTRDVTSQQDAAEIYAASFMAIEVDTEAERDYLARLAGALKLPREAVERIHNSLNVAV